MRRSKVSEDSRAISLNADELRTLLATATAHSPRSAAVITPLTSCGLRISGPLGADLRDYGHDAGHRVLTTTRKGGKMSHVPLLPVVVRALDTHLAERLPTRPAAGDEPIFCGPVGSDGPRRYTYRSAYDQSGRLCRAAGPPAGTSPHRLRHSCATEALRLGAALQDVRDARGHADPRTTRRCHRSRPQLDRSPDHLLASA